MATSLKLADSLSKCISSTTAMAPQSLWICRGFVSATRPSQKMDKDTCKRVIEAADAVKEGAREVRSVVQDVRETIATGAGSAVKKVAEKAMEQAAQGEAEEEKGTWEKVKDKTKAIKKEVLGDKK